MTEEYLSDLIEKNKKKYGKTADVSESARTVGSLSVYRLCDNCNKEFAARAGIELAEKPTGLSHNITMEECPYCKTQNHLWVRLVRK